MIDIWPILRGKTKLVKTFTNHWEGDWPPGVVTGSPLAVQSWAGPGDGPGSNSLIGGGPAVQNRGNSNGGSAPVSRIAAPVRNARPGCRKSIQARRQTGPGCPGPG
ncbi:hypothetical protein GCM10009526_04730 [Glutamicibacter creatinolyticus]